MTMREDGVVQKQEEPFVEMHPEDAQALGMTEGDWVRLVSRRGELEARARLGDRVYPGSSGWRSTSPRRRSTG